MTGTSGQLWAIVLAAGDRRQPVPKPYVAMAGSRSRFQRMLDLASTLAPPERTVVVIARGHEEWAWPQTVDRPGITILVEPMNRDTGPAVLLPLAHVLAKDPDARVAVLPTEHHVARPDLLLAGIRTAVELRDTIALIGVPAEHPETECGWIVAGPRVGSGAARPVRRFVERPSPERAERLMGMGAFSNTFIFTGPARALWDAARRALPAQTAVFEAYGEAIGSPLESVGREIAYTWLERASFTRAVLAHTRGLVMIPVEECGWADLGTTDHVLAAFAGSAETRIARPAPIVSDATLAV